MIHGDELTDELICEAEHPGTSDTSVVKITWYKGLDALDNVKYFGFDEVVSSPLPLEGQWADSATYKCLFEYVNPYIPPIFSSNQDIAYIGIFRSSMYRFKETGSDFEQDKLYLTKTTSRNLKLDCYLQTEKKTEIITGVEWLVYEGSASFENEVVENENSPFETASRFKASAELKTDAAGDVVVGCQYSFNDQESTTQFSKFAVRTLAPSGVYAESYPSDMMLSFSEYSRFMTQTRTVWNKQLTVDLNYNFDENYNIGGLNSESPATIYADWDKVYGSTLGSSATCTASLTKTTCILPTDYALSPAAKDLTQYKSNMIMASTVKSGEEYFAAPAFVGYVPTIYTTNGTKVHGVVSNLLTFRS